MTYAERYLSQDCFSASFELAACDTCSEFCPSDELCGGLCGGCCDKAARVALVVADERLTPRTPQDKYLELWREDSSDPHIAQFTRVGIEEYAY